MGYWTYAIRNEIACLRLPLLYIFLPPEIWPYSVVSFNKALLSHYFCGGSSGGTWTSHNVMISANFVFEKWVSYRLTLKPDQRGYKLFRIMNSLESKDYENIWKWHVSLFPDYQLFLNLCSLGGIHLRINSLWNSRECLGKEHQQKYQRLTRILVRNWLGMETTHLILKKHLTLNTHQFLTERANGRRTNQINEQWKNVLV